VLVGAGVGAYLVLDQSGQQSVQLRERVRGDVQQAVDQIEGLIRDNTQ
jgi:hypothetical protein